MAADYTILVGTVAHGVMRSMDGGETFYRNTAPFRTGSKCRALAVYPDNSHRVLAGTDNGIFRSEDNRVTWEKLVSPMDDTTEIYSIAIDPTDPNIIFGGTNGAHVFRSKDDGKAWQKMDTGMPRDCRLGIPRVLAMSVDPRDHRKVWAGVEIGGVFQSLDGGDTWTHRAPMGGEPNHEDIHSIVFSLSDPTKILISCPLGVFASSDEGKTWDLNVMKPAPYCRGVTVKADDPKTIFVANGSNAETVILGDIQRSKDGGESWEELPLPVEPNSQMDWIATHPSRPNVLAAGSLLGDLFSTTDGGES